MNRFAKIQAVNSNTQNLNLHLTKVGEEQWIDQSINQTKVGEEQWIDQSINQTKVGEEQYALLSLNWELKLFLRGASNWRYNRCTNWQIWMATKKKN
jgi:hypothetical protein